MLFEFVGIVWTDPGTHNVLYHEDDIDLCNGEEVVHQPGMTAIFGHEAVEQRNSDTLDSRLGVETDDNNEAVDDDDE